MQLAREEEVHKKTVALLAERVKELEQVKSKLGSTEQDVEQKASELKTAAAEKAVLADEALAKQAELKEAAELITGLEKELEEERMQLAMAVERHRSQIELKERVAEITGTPASKFSLALGEIDMVRMEDARSLAEHGLRVEVWPWRYIAADGRTGGRQ